ncbi:alpha-L-glutamate ligase [Arenicella chitinivorans]|uniref:Alpha-L-glutamate ligase n=1 Tax=Arenicella chitinivorans TaxID=1329800 RepID=A0A918VJY7_9GAMM|nr:RimK family alpha-L-glutamate ligase [Arenicella chitinivorans]GHA03647.1 alpha-L-glutamate ligase [Arenicella chitinivorans]
MSKQSPKTVVGNQEWCAFPELGIPAVKARVDSGAKTSSLHAFNVRRFRRGKQAWISFDVHPVQKNRTVVVKCEQPLLDMRVVKSSSGVPETRYVIRTAMRMGDQQWEVDLTLANRDSMGFRMLLGRQAMHGRVVVDPSLENALGDHNSAALNSMYQHAAAERQGLRIAVLASNPEDYNNRRLLEAGRARGHDMVFLNISQCHMRLDALEPEVLFRGSPLAEDLDAVIPRVRAQVTYYGAALVRQFESMGILSINSAVAIAQSQDRLLVMQSMLKHGIPIPTSGFAHSPADAEALIDMVGGTPVLIKPVAMRSGGSAAKADDLPTAKQLITTARQIDENLLVQEYMAAASGRSIRSLVVNQKPVATLAYQAETRADQIEVGTVVGTAKLTAAERTLVAKATKALSLSVARVDLIRTEEGTLLLGVVAAPDFEPFERQGRKRVAESVIAAIEKKLRWRAGE